MANGQNAAIFGQIASVVMGAINQSQSNPYVGSTGAPMPTVTTKSEVVEALASDPVVVNQLNAEPPIQSRVGWGGSIATVGSGIAGIVGFGTTMGWITPSEGAQLTGGLTGLLGAAGAIYALWGRFAPGLKPMFSSLTAGK